MSDIKSIKDRMDRKQAISILEEMKAVLVNNTHAAIKKAAALDIAIDFIKGNWKSGDVEQPEQHTAVIIWDAHEKAMGEAYWDGNNFLWVCDGSIAHATLWKEYEPPLESGVN